MWHETCPHHVHAVLYLPDWEGLIPRDILAGNVNGGNGEQDGPKYTFLKVTCFR